MAMDQNKAKILQFLDNYEEDENGKTSPKSLQEEITKALGIIFYQYDYLSFGKIIKAKFPFIKLVNKKGTYCYPIRKRNQANQEDNQRQENVQPSSSQIHNQALNDQLINQLANDRPLDDNQPIELQLEKLKQVNQKIDEMLKKQKQDNVKNGSSNLIGFDYQNHKDKILQFISNNYKTGGKTYSKDLRSDLSKNLGIEFNDNHYNILGRIIKSKWQHIRLRKQSSAEVDENGQRKPIYYYCISKINSLPRTKKPNFRHTIFPQSNSLFRVVKQKDSQDQSRFVVQPVRSQVPLNQSSDQGFNPIRRPQNQTDNQQSQAFNQMINNQILLNSVNELLEKFKVQIREEFKNQMNIQLFNFKNQIKQELTEHIKEDVNQEISLQLEKLINNFKKQLENKEREELVDDEQMVEGGEIDLTDDQTYGTEFNLGNISLMPFNN